MSAIAQIIRDISATGARFIISESGVGIDRQVSSDLLNLAKQHKEAIRDYLLQQWEADKQRGIQMLASAATGLPVNQQELTDFFRDDLEAIGAGEISREALLASVRWYAKHYGKPAQHERDLRVKCCDCQQTRCPYPLAYGRHNSTQPRWCSNYTPAWRA